MADFYTNLPPKDKDNLDKTIEKLTTSAYEEEFQFNAGEYDAAVAFFLKRGFKRQVFRFSVEFACKLSIF